MIVCIFEHVQWRWAFNDRLAWGYSPRDERRLGENFGLGRAVIKKEAPILVSASAMKQTRGGAKQRGIATEPYGLAVF